MGAHVRLRSTDQRQRRYVIYLLYCPQTDPLVLPRLLVRHLLLMIYSRQHRPLASTLFFFSASRFPFAWPPRNPPFQDYVRALGLRRGKACFVTGPLLLHAAGLRPPNFILPERWDEWMYKYRRVAVSLDIVAYSDEMATHLSSTHVAKLLRSMPASTSILLQWARSVKDACLHDLPIPPLLEPASDLSDANRRRQMQLENI